MRNILFILMAFECFVSIGQIETKTEVKTGEGESEKQKTELLEYENQKKYKQFVDRLSERENVNMGVISLARPYSAKIKAIKGDTNIIRIQIESVTIIIEQGRIKKLSLIPKKHIGYFKNTGSISLTSFEKCKNYELNYSGADPVLQNTKILIGDFLNYLDVTSRLAYPPDDIITLNESKQFDSLIYSSSPVDFFDVRAYSDTKGLSGEPNGLAQTEINVAFLASTTSRKNSYLTTFPFVNLSLSLSKFDSKFDTLLINNFKNRAHNEILRMTQYSNICFRTEFELFRYSRVNDGYLVFGHQILSTKMQDSSTSIVKNIFTPSFYAALGGIMFSFPKIKGAFKLPLFFNYVNDQPFTDYIKNFNLTIVPEIEIIIDPTTPKAKDEEKQTEVSGTTIFGRIKYFDMPNHRGNNFWQIQIGAQIPLTKAFN